MSNDLFFTLKSGEQIPVIIESRRGMRNVTLRPKSVPRREIHISKPWLTSSKFALRFLESKRKWIEKIYNTAPVKATIHPGDKIEFLGHIVTLVHCPDMRANRYLDDDKMTLGVGGGIDMFQRRVRDFIKDEFQKSAWKIIREQPREYWPRNLTLRDTTSRWGSCSSTGTVSFSWRLAFAPPEVMRYVIMHELAHRKHMDHSPEFWETVSELYGFGVERAKLWLSKNGQSLHKYF